MEINQLKYFKAVADTGKIVDAAKEMFVTPPAVSSSIAALEKELNTPLFVRKGNRLVLNRQGEIFLDYVNYILVLIADAQSDLRESLRESQEQVVVGVTAMHPFVELFADFMRKYPSVGLTTASINTGDINTAGLNSRFSFLMAAEMDPPEEYANACHSLYLFQDSPAVMVHQNHPWANKEWIDPEELAGEKLLFNRNNSRILDQILLLFQSRLLTLPILTTHHMTLNETILRKNGGILLTTVHSAKGIDPSYALVPIHAPECMWNTRIFWRKDRELSPESLAFLDFVKEYFDL